MGLIMVVDDMAMVREPMAMSIRSAGFQAICATDGVDALAKFKTQRPDAILLDMEMPIMNGLEFLRILRALPEGVRVPVICLTAHGNRNCVEEAVKLGAQDYILKTRFSMAEMLTKIKHQLAAVAPPAPAPKAQDPKHPLPSESATVHATRGYRPPPRMHLAPEPGSK